MIVVLDASGTEIGVSVGPRRGTLLSVAVLVLAIAVPSWYGISRRTSRRAQHGATTTTWTTGTVDRNTFAAQVDIDSQPADLEPVRDPKVLGAYDSALRQWSYELHRPIGRPDLFEGEGCGQLRVACAMPFANRIILATSTMKTLGDRYDLRTILMHELGHMLGVPHIEGDALMDATYHSGVDTPTAAAVALAKLGEPGKVGRRAQQ